MQSKMASRSNTAPPIQMAASLLQRQFDAIINRTKVWMIKGSL